MGLERLIFDYLKADHCWTCLDLFLLVSAVAKKTKAFAVGWIALMYLRNLILMSAVSGELHLYFYIFTKQGQYLKYDPQPLMKIGRKFTLAGQVKDNMFWTLASGITIWTVYEVLMVWALANGYAPMLTWSAHPV